MLRPGAQSLQTARAAAALPAAGAYDAAPTELSCQAAGAVTLFTTYTRAGVGGWSDELTRKVVGTSEPITMEIGGGSWTLRATCSGRRAWIA